MADTGTAKSKPGSSDAKEESRKPESGTIEQNEERNLDRVSEAEEKQREEGRISGERNEQQDLTQGMETGTHDSIRHGVNWGPAYQARNTTDTRPEKKDEPKKTSD